MCIEVNGYKFKNAFEVQINNNEKVYRILMTDWMDNQYIKGFYGVCIDNGIFYISKIVKPIAMSRIVGNIIAQTRELEKYNEDKYPRKKITYLGAINGTASNMANECIRKREEELGDEFTFIEKMLKLSLVNFYGETELTKILHTTIKGYPHAV